MLSGLLRGRGTMKRYALLAVAVVVFWPRVYCNMCCQYVNGWTFRKHVLLHVQMQARAQAEVLHAMTGRTARKG